MRGPALDGIDRRANLVRMQRIDDQHLAAPRGRGEALEGGSDRIHGADGGLAAERLTELEQKIVAGGNGGDVDRGVAARGSAGGTRGRRRGGITR